MEEGWGAGVGDMREEGGGWGNENISSLLSAPKCITATEAFSFAVLPHTNKRYIKTSSHPSVIHHLCRLTQDSNHHRYHLHSTDTTNQKLSPHLNDITYPPSVISVRRSQIIIILQNKNGQTHVQSEKQSTPFNKLISQDEAVSQL